MTEFPLFFEKREGFSHDHRTSPLRARIERRPAPWLCWIVLVVFAVLLPVLYQILFEFVRTASVTNTILYLQPRLNRLLLGTFPLTAFYLFMSIATRRL